MIKKFLKRFFVVLGVVFTLFLILAITPAPFYMHYNLGQDPNQDTTYIFEPQHIIMMGGAGMPSANNLMRLYYTAGLASFYDCPVTIALPYDSICHAKIDQYLVNQGVTREIIHDTIGTNTRSQVLALSENYPELLTTNILVITSPEHLRRTVKCFNKAGFQQVRGVAAYEGTVDFDLSLENQILKGKETIPSVESTKLRYTFWNYLKLEIDTYREYFALFYYRIKGWI
ncbi:MAG: YdcF family protein [Bacteroidales bacterium]|nr:YdcF family protein [Bacteroidales bacterium]